MGGDTHRTHVSPLWRLRRHYKISLSGGVIDVYAWKDLRALQSWFGDLEFLDLFGDAQSIKRADDRHAKLFLHHKSTSESKKRNAEDFLVSDKTKLAKSYSAVPVTAPSVMGAYPNAQNQWVAGYGLQPQAWPQVTQAQGQQWNPGYTQQQAAFGAYGSYGSSYANPQVPTSVPQNAAYGAYPPSYPVQQAYPQQNYVQSATTAAAAPAQQPASVATQAYYGSYY